VTDPSSVKELVNHLQTTHGEQSIDFVINNAGIALDGFDSNIVRTTLACNYTATLSASRAFLPLLKLQTGRLVNVASTSGSLAKYSSTLRTRFLAAKSEQDVSSIMQDFQKAVDEGREKDAGFPSAAYAVSKAGLIGGTRVIAQEVEKEGSGVRVNTCCPGYVNTDMSKGNGTKSPDEGAATLVCKFLTLRFSFCCCEKHVCEIGMLIFGGF
jgi:carbonyl reductase 1